MENLTIRKIITDKKYEIQNSHFIIDIKSEIKSEIKLTPGKYFIYGIYEINLDDELTL
jgi:hypothetical protein